MGRIESLLTLLESNGDTRHPAIVQLFKELVTADNRKYSLRDLFSTHTELLALLVTENAGHTGEHYVTSTRREYFGMLRSGMGAGLIVGPLFVVAEAGFALGWRAPLREAIERRAGPLRRGPGGTSSVAG